MKILEIIIRLSCLLLWVFCVLPFTLIVSFLIWESMPIKHWSKVCWVYIMKEQNPEDFLID